MEFLANISLVVFSRITSFEDIKKKISNGRGLELVQFRNLVLFAMISSTCHYMFIRFEVKRIGVYGYV